MVASEFQRIELDPSEDPLWHRIQEYDLEALDPTLSFSGRLARDNGWNIDYACRVAEEYKRFCYLALTAGHPVYPPENIDQAWQLHLSYSRDYWGKFCSEVLGSDLHHQPVQFGDDEEADKLRETYVNTIAAYERISDERPPSDIWPISELLFADCGSMRRVNLKYYMVLRRLPKGLLWVTQIVMVLATLSLLWQEKFVIAFIVGAAAVAIAVFRDSTDNKWITKPWRDGDDDGTSSGGGSIRGI